MFRLLERQLAARKDVQFISQPGDYKIHTDETGRNTLMTVVRC